ncbi:MAG TPA: cytochrome c oxidase subunit 4 [Candidatus Limnocylindrales bacterium]|jgi:hypothetical protein
MTAEVRLFARMAVFGVLVGIVYWFLTYEVVGTVLLILFGVSAGIAAIATYLLQRAGKHPLGRPDRPEPAAELDGPEPAAELDGEPVPAPGWAPLGIAIGLGGVAIGAAFGPWALLAGLLLAIWSGKAWLNAAMRETSEARGIRRAAEHDGGPRGLRRASPGDRGAPAEGAEDPARRLPGAGS